MNKYENGSFILFTLVPHRVPFIAHLHIILSLQVFHCPDLFVKQIMPYRSSSRFNCKGSKQKWGWSRGVEPLGGGQRAKPPEVDAFWGPNHDKSPYRVCISYKPDNRKAILKLLMHKNNIIFSYFPFVYWGGNPLQLPPKVNEAYMYISTKEEIKTT